MNIGIDWLYIFVLPLALFMLAVMTGKAKLQTFSDMVSERLYMSSMYLSIAFLFIAVLLSESVLPSIVQQLLSVLIAIFTGTFLTTIVADITLNILTNKVSFLSKRTFTGLLLISVMFLFVLFVDNLESFMSWLSKYLPSTVLKDDSLTLVGWIIGVFFLYCTYWLYKGIVLPIIEQRSSNKQLNRD